MARKGKTKKVIGGWRLWNPKKRKKFKEQKEVDKAMDGYGPSMDGGQGHTDMEYYSECC